MVLSRPFGPEHISSKYNVYLNRYRVSRKILFLPLNFLYIIEILFNPNENQFVLKFILYKKMYTITAIIYYIT